MEYDKCMLTLDQIIDSVLDNGALNGESPEFVRICEKKFSEELLNYTRSIFR